MLSAVRIYERGLRRMRPGNPQSDSGTECAAEYSWNAEEMNLHASFVNTYVLSYVVYSDIIV